MNPGISNKNSQPPQRPSQRIEGYDSTMTPASEDKKTINVEGIGEMEFRNEVVAPAKALPKSESLNLFDEPVVKNVAIDASQIPEPGVPAKIHNPQAREEINRGVLRGDGPVGPLVPDLTADLDQMGEVVPMVATNLSEYNIAHSHAKFSGIDHIIVSKKVFDYFMRSQKRNEKDPELDYFIHADVRVYQEGTKDKIDIYESRRSQ